MRITAFTSKSCRKATLIDSENYLLICMRYIELNSVRAGMVSHPSNVVEEDIHNSHRP